MREITAFGKTQGLYAWARDSGLPVGTLNARIGRGWLAEKAISTPVARSRTVEQIKRAVQGRASAPKAKAALRRLKRDFPENIYGLLAFAILERTVLDLLDKDGDIRKAALDYLKTEMWCCELVEIESAYVRRVLKIAGVMG